MTGHTNNESKRLFVSNLHPETSDQDLNRFFDSAVEVRRTVDVICNRFYRTAFITFSDSLHARSALSKNGEDFRGYSIQVTLA